MRRQRTAWPVFVLMLLTGVVQAQEVDVVSYFGFKGQPRLIEEREVGVGGVWERTYSFAENRLSYSRVTVPVDVKPAFPGSEYRPWTDAYEFDPTTRVITIVQSEEWYQQLHLDDQGRLARSTSYSVSPTGGCVVRTAERTYSEDGSTASVLDMRRGCGDDFDTTDTIYFDSEGRAYKREAFWLDGELDTVTHYTYDGMGETIEMRSCDGDGQECQGRRYEYAYDATGNWVTRVQYVLDAEGQQYVLESTTTRVITYY